MYYYIKHCTFGRYQPAISLLTVQKAERLGNPSRRMQIMSMHSSTASPALQELSVSAKKEKRKEKKERKKITLLFSYLQNCYLKVMPLARKLILSLCC